MSLKIGDNFKYQGKLSNFDRDSFKTLSEMKNFPETSLDEGHVSYCEENKKRYIYRSSNPISNTTGKWKLLTDTALDATSENPVQNKKIVEKFNLLELAARATEIAIRATISELEGKLIETEKLTSASINEIVESLNIRDLVISAALNELEHSKLDNDVTINGYLISSGDIVLKKGDVGLGNVDNTSDLNKPISTLTRNALSTKVDKIEGYSLVSDTNIRKLTSLPTVDELNSSVGEVLSNLETHKQDYDNPHGVTKSQVGLSNVDNTSDVNKPISTAQQTALDKKADKSTTINGHALSSNVEITKGDVGLGDVDNTSDINKPISTATQTALDLKTDVLDFTNHKEDTDNPHEVTKSQIGLGNVTNDSQVKRSEMGVAGGVATLDSKGLIPSSQLPSYVDDVIEASSFNNLPAKGETGKIYVTLDNNLTYRWSGSSYVEISASLAIGTTTGTAYDGGSGKALADTVSGHIGNTSNPHSVTKSQVGLGNVDNTSDINKPISTAQQTALDKKVDKTVTINSHALSGNVTVTKGDVGLGNVDNTSDLNKPLSGPQQEAIEKVERVISASIAEIVEYLNTLSDLTAESFNKLEKSKLSRDLTINGQVLNEDNLTLSKSDIGLGNVDNTSDLSKPISTATQTALNGKVGTSTTVNGHALSGNVTVTKGDVGLGSVDNTSDANKPISTAQQTALDKKADKTITVNGHAISSNVTVTKGDVGLGNVDNTSDINKPISTATQNALNGKVGTSTTVNGHALSSNVTVTKGDVGLGNVDNTSDINKPISTATQTALNGKVETSTFNNHTGNTSNPHGVTKSQVGLGNVDNTSDFNKPISNATRGVIEDNERSISASITELSESFNAFVSIVSESLNNITQRLIKLESV